MVVITPSMAMVVITPSMAMVITPSTANIRSMVAYIEDYSKSN